jgi:hypothetical protein
MSEAGWMLLGVFVAVGVGASAWGWVYLRNWRYRRPRPPEPASVPPPAVWRSGRTPPSQSTPAYRRRGRVFRDSE